ncbi:MAG: CHAT domain-containing protein [Theionarchaea archaeon]|nr:CHAT domain-containing protein [Theionarchaea archaeon]
MWITFIPLSRATASAWSYHIEGITASAMSRNGEYVIIGTQEGYFYVFDKFGNVLRTDQVTSKITVLGISENGTFFIGTTIGYYLSTLKGEPQIDFNDRTPVTSVSMSDDGEGIIVGTQRQIYLFLQSTLAKELYVCASLETCTKEDQVKTTAISSLGEVAVAATETFLHLSKNTEGTWRSREFDGEKITALAISDNGEIVVCGTWNGSIFVFDSDLNYITSCQTPGRVEDIEISADGTNVLCGIENGLIALLRTDGRIVWQRKSEEFSGPVCISSDDKIIAVTGSRLDILDHSGKTLQGISVPGELNEIHLSRNGQYLWCVTTDEVVFYELYDNTYRFTREYRYSSRKSLPLSDTLVEKASLLSAIERPNRFQIGDIDGDGENEIIIESGKKIVVTDKVGRILSEIDFASEPQLQRLLDVTGDLIPEIIISHSDGRMSLEFYSGKGEFLAQHEFFNQWWSQPTVGINISPFAAFDIDDDGRIEVICVLSAAYVMIPRGIYVFEYPTFSDEWFYPYAPIVVTATLVDLDGDEDLEILIGSNAPCNGRSVGNTDDCHAYVAAVDSQGNELWIREVGEGYTRAWIDAADLDDDGSNEIVCCGWYFDDTWGKLFVLDKDGDYVCGEDNVFQHSVFLGGISDLDDDGKKEILVFTSDGNIIIYDSLLNLNCSRNIEMNMTRLTSAIINDIDADGEKEIILSSNDERVYILDRALDIEWTTSFPGVEKRIYSLVTALFGCKNDLILLSDTMHVYSHQYDNASGPCPLWEITERTLSEEANANEILGQSAFEGKNYISSRIHYKNALEIYTELEDGEKIGELSETVFKLDIRIGLILLVVSDIGLCAFMTRSWLRRRWSNMAEGGLLLSLPVLLGLLEVHAAHENYLRTFATFTTPFLIGSVVIILRRKVIGFSRTIASILSGHKDVLVLSIMRSDGSYRVSAESIGEKFRPVKESRIVELSPAMKKELVKKAEFVVRVISQFSSTDEQEVPIDYAEDVLAEIGGAIFSRFIPQDFSDILRAKFLLLEVEDTEIPWELMFSHTFFASKYAVSRRIVASESVTVRQRKTNGKRALVICDPSGTLPDARKECRIVYGRLNQKMETVYIEGSDATIQDVTSLLNTGFDIIHFAGHVENGLVLSDGIMHPESVRACVSGIPVVFVNGCKSEDLAQAFLLGGAMAYVGTLHPVHDDSAAEIASDFYDLCLQYQIGEALRRARENHRERNLVWASLVMYGDPTLKLF